MHGINPIDAGRNIDWSKTSTDYATYRPGPPQRLYDCLLAFGVGSSGQNILDLGTGTGVLARQFASQGAIVAGIDIATGQIEMARQLAEREQLDVDFQVGSAEKIPFPDNTFDAITANQCWLYFDKSLAIPEVKRVLKPDGVLVTSHFSWLPRLDPIAYATEQLVLQHNPDWSASDWAGVIPNVPSWSHDHFDVNAMFFFDAEIPFTWHSWCGRIRACRGVGATLDPDQVTQFNAEHLELLKSLVPEQFTIRHRIDAHIFTSKQS